MGMWRRVGCVERFGEDGMGMLQVRDEVEDGC